MYTRLMEEVRYALLSLAIYLEALASARMASDAFSANM